MKDIITKKETEKQESKKPLLSKRGKIIILVSTIIIVVLAKVGKAKAIVPLVAWFVAIAGSYVIGESINFLGLNPLAPEGGGAGATFTGQVAGNEVASALLLVFNGLLFAVFWLVSKLLIVAGILLDAMIDPKIFTSIMNSEGVSTGWRFVRDFLNLFFILVILFSAFCTIFQTQKYNLKKVLLMVVLMALLVNFSFPISRFIIDLSNVTMYFIVNNAFGSNSKISASILDTTAVGDWLQSSIKINGTIETTAQIIMSTILVLILFVTLLAYGLNLLIRAVALAVIVVLSPVGFAMAILPGTKIASYADEWWSSLFKYAFMGPIMAFFLWLAITILGTITLPSAGSANVESPQGFVGTIAYFAVPVVFLWVGLAASLKMGGAASGLAMNVAKKTGNWAKRQPWRGTKALVGATGVSGGMKQAYDYRRKKGIKLFGKYRFGAEQREEKEAKIAGYMTKGMPGYEAAGRNIKRKRIAEKMEETKKLKPTKFDAINNLDSSDEIERVANALYLSQNSLIKDATEYEKAMTALSSDPDLQKEITDKIKKDDKIKILIDYDISKGITPSAAYQKHLGAIGPKDLTKQKDLNPVTNNNFKLYIENNVVGGPGNLYQDVFKELTPTQRAEWLASGLPLP